MFEYFTLGDGRVEILGHCRYVAHLRQHAVDHLFAVLFRPYGVSFAVVRDSVRTLGIHHPQIDDIPMIRNSSGTFYAAIFGDDVAIEHDQRTFRYGAGGEKVFFPPCPFLSEDIGIQTVGNGVEIIDTQHVGTHGFVFYTARCFSGADGHESRAASGFEKVLRPLSEGLLFSIVLPDAPICFQFGPIRL